MVEFPRSINAMIEYRVKMKNLFKQQPWFTRRRLFIIAVFWCLSLFTAAIYCYSHSLVTNSNGVPDALFSLGWSFKIHFFWLFAIPIFLTLSDHILRLKKYWEKCLWTLFLVISTSLAGFVIQLLLWWPVKASQLPYLSYLYIPKAFIACGVLFLIAIYTASRSQLIINTPQPDPQTSSQLLVMSGNAQKLITLENVLYIQTSGNYLELFTDTQSFLYRSTMKTMTDKLISQGFIRVHRQHLVNTKWIEKLITNESGQPQLQMKGGALLPVGRNYKSALAQFKI